VRPSYRVLIAAAVPILLLIVTSLGRAGAARDIPIAGPESSIVRDPVRRPSAPAAMPDVRLAQLDPAPPDRVPTLARNPFEYAPRSAPPPPAPPPVAIAPPPVPLVIPPSVSLSLIGVATNTRADGRVERTAIIASRDTLYMVREADAVTAGYRVDAVSSDSVLLVDAAGAPLRLHLR